MIIRKTFFDVDDMMNEVLSSDYIDNISIIGKFDYVRMIIKCFLTDGGMMPYGVEINDSLWDGYDKEFMVNTIENNVFCEKFYRGDNYLTCSGNIIIVMPDCSDECIRYIKGRNEKDVIYFVEFLEDGLENVCSDDAQDDSGCCAVKTSFNINIGSFDDIIKLVKMIWR